MKETEKENEHFSSYPGPVFAQLIGKGKKETTLFPNVESRIPKSLP